MTDEDTRLGLALRDGVLKNEPTTSVDPEQIRVRARRVRTQRRSVLAGSLAAVVAGVSITGQALSDNTGSDTTVSPAAETVTKFSPDGLVRSFQASVSRAQGQAGLLARTNAS